MNLLMHLSVLTSHDHLIIFISALQRVEMKRIRWIYGVKVTDRFLCDNIINPSLFHSRRKTYLFHKSFPRSSTSSSRAAFTDYRPKRFF